MRIHSIIHASFEKLGAIEPWIIERNHLLSMTHTYKGECLPDTDEFDLLIVMGGPQSPLSIEKWPYLQNEISFIKKSIEANKAVLGICLGAQLIAESLGAKTESSPHREIGVFPVELTQEGSKDPVFSQFPHSFSAMHWHNDMPGLPTNALLLAQSAGCPRQAFRVSDRVYGLQCHLEMTPSNVAEMIQHCEKDLSPGLYIQTKQELLSDHLKSANEKIFALLDYLSWKVA